MLIVANVINQMSLKNHLVAHVIVKNVAVIVVGVLFVVVAVVKKK